MRGRSPLGQQEAEVPGGRTSISISPPILAWRRCIELPIRSPLDERTREGDDHLARLFLRFLPDQGERGAVEVIWGNRLKPADYKYIGGLPHFIADASEDRVGKMALREDRPRERLR